MPVNPARSRKAQNNTQLIVEVVGYTAREVSNRIHFMRLLEFAVEAVAFRLRFFLSVTSSTVPTNLNGRPSGPKSAALSTCIQRCSPPGLSKRYPRCDIPARFQRKQLP